MDKENIDAVLGSRFLENSKVQNYPLNKLILNRLFNFFVSVIFWNKYNDYTNAFKIYKRDVLVTLMPFVSESFYCKKYLIVIKENTKDNSIENRFKNEIFIFSADTIFLIP